MEEQLRWFGLIHHMPDERLAKSIYETKVQGKNKKGMPRRTWNEAIKQERHQTGNN